MTIGELRHELEQRGISVPESAFDSFVKLAALLKEWNAKFNLTAIDEPEEVYEKHILDCLLPLKTEDIHGSVLDVGSGAGFPGLIWAIVRPDCMFTLLEPTAKRCRYLETAAKELALSNVRVENARAEEFVRDHRESFDVVTARAVANLPVLSELCVPLVKTGGFFSAMKGAQGEAEANEAAYALRVLGCEDPEVRFMRLPSGDERTVVHAGKVKETPGKYPRAYGQIKHKPLLGKG
ncbi:MAG: 16S rRNA (guanine(527)-N(7))-methyltransferase RsmG [Solobacterium sp.]|nr:16S rRNA (guanine(527)-N(7))-methyltransferase RsmG [Solobacterium sp.]